MSYNPLSVIAHYFPLDDFIFTYNLDSAVVAADVGKALMLDTSGACKMKLTTDNAVIDGRLFSFEDRSQQGGGKVGAVERKFRARLPYTGSAPTVGQTVSGSATAGVVKVATTQASHSVVVIEVDAANGYVTVEAL